MPNCPESRNRPAVTVSGDTPSYNTLGDVDNIVITAPLVGGYTLSEVVVNGTVTDNGQTGNWISDADIMLTTPGGSIDLDGSAVDGDNGGAGDTVSNSHTAGLGFDPAGSATLEFYEQFDEGPGGTPTGVVDADNVWTDVTLDLYDDSGTADTVVDGNFALGMIPSDATKVLGPGQDGNSFHTGVLAGLDFFTFDIDAVGSIGSYLNIQTIDPVTGDTIDTEIALYDAAGMLIAADDDGQETALGGLYSLLSFGTADPLSGDQTAGVDGASLAAGSYTLVVGAFDAVFAPLLGDVVGGTGTFASRAGDYELSLTHLVPEPSSALMLLIGLVGFMSTRRR